MRIALLQFNPTVGDLAGNAQRIASGVNQARLKGANLVVTPELALLGYPPRDLLLNRGFIQSSGVVLRELAAELTAGPPVLVGIAEANTGNVGRPLYNTAALLQRGRIEQRFRKALLPTYDVFDEDRYFEPGIGPQILHLEGRQFGISICEDVWNDRDFWQYRRYHTDPVEELAQQGVECLLNLSASPFTVGKQQIRERMLGCLARRHHFSLLYVNQAGGNDDLVFDGRSCAFSASGKLIARGRPFVEDLVLVDLDTPHDQIADDDFRPEAEIWQALVVGTRDYVKKCGFGSVVWDFPAV